MLVDKSVGNMRITCAIDEDLTEKELIPHSKVDVTQILSGYY
jgi:hypothetical protein